MARSRTAESKSRAGGPPQFRVVEGSEKDPMPRSYVVSRPNPQKLIEVTVLVRPRPPVPGRHVVTPDELGAQPPLKRHYLSRESFAEGHGADPADIHEVAKFANQYGLRVVGENVGASALHLSGTIANFSAAFHVVLFIYRHAQGYFRGRTGPVYTPAALEGVIVGVFGLDTRPVGRPHFRRKRSLGGAWPLTTHESFTPDEIAKLYNFPPTTGTGQCVGIIELGGGYTKHDLDRYFTKLGIETPQVVPVHVQGKRNLPTGNPNGPDAEVMLDIEIVGAVAPGATIAVYFAPNTDQGVLRAINRAVHDKINQPSVISISWGGPESSWTRQSLLAIDGALQAASLMGVTVCVASGDGGATDGIAGARAHVDFPASSPHALACGGTSILLGALGIASGITGEYVWNDGPRNGASGGGVSDFFPLPTWQTDAGVPASINPGGRVGRGVPDVAANADQINSGYSIRVDGADVVLGGTSAAAPLWAGLIALMNAQVGKPLGFLNPLLYKLVAGTDLLNDITQGFNGLTAMSNGYSAGPGWDACTGFGSPNGTKLLAALLGEVDAPVPMPAVAPRKKRVKRAARAAKAKRPGRTPKR